MTHIRPVTVADSKDWLHMRCALWPEGSEGEHRDEIERFFADQLRNPLEVLLAVDDTGAPVGFVELSLRSYAEDCVTDCVAYLEGWYVVPEARRGGVGRALVGRLKTGRENRVARNSPRTRFSTITLVRRHTARLASRRQCRSVVFERWSIQRSCFSISVAVLACIHQTRRATSKSIQRARSLDLRCSAISAVV